MPQKTDSLNASKSGQRFEVRGRELFERLGYPVLHLKKQFVERDLDYYKLFRISNHPFLELGYKNSFNVDGYSPDLKCILELKGTKQEAGTAQEKIGWDYWKIIEGVYATTGCHLLYIFQGCMEKHPCAIAFENQLKKSGVKGVTILKESEITKEVLDNLKKVCYNNRSV
ncbi:hypothetical protein Syn7803C17_184 [Synechococcus phage ACG-2014f]|uniref:Uncharacterized protein n=2 Tax=Atlauavirus tusconc8 TaxID=2734085 RepID=A0A0E3G361_9CAUD|nr:hypothetical protein HOQ62_gp188 [Synechococcus phage ACG-2014f_Syn7803C8]AIX29581.1 hypothetical protein Syn7803US30_185 [Synechococcus phage ACG-2014f]AIX21512.1 hypothetical protein Syn7803C8_188 [Synechococcus phage ACG-2014f_Syn7803C8]AIX31531.1 hypothetical protein Syn7803US40_187 [Synechococcus phage ACG-2014f]AIX31817.1 hypothetical protein Syn7803US42_189 [Synechococcus phage ACG-2014f]AIX33172.1 hypothetical protein Syn7803US50_188 [Synechococcus phage ACG-2014f]